MRVVQFHAFVCNFVPTGHTIVDKCGTQAHIAHGGFLLFFIDSKSYFPLYTLVRRRLEVATTWWFHTVITFRSLQLQNSIHGGSTLASHPSQINSKNQAILLSPIKQKFGPKEFSHQCPSPKYQKMTLFSCRISLVPTQESIEEKPTFNLGSNLESRSEVHQDML